MDYAVDLNGLIIFLYIYLCIIACIYLYICNKYANHIFLRNTPSFHRFFQRVSGVSLAINIYIYIICIYICIF